MFGIGFGELIIIFVVALLVVGPQKLPEMAKGLAKIFREIRKTSDEFQASIFREGGPSVSGLLKSPQATIKRHLENEVQEALGFEDTSETTEPEHCEPAAVAVAQNENTAVPEQRSPERAVAAKGPEDKSHKEGDLRG